MKKSAYRSASAPVKRYQYLRDITTHVALGSVFFSICGFEMRAVYTLFADLALS